jgi:hypothetical protein
MDLALHVTDEIRLGQGVAYEKTKSDRVEKGDYTE